MWKVLFVIQKFDQCFGEWIDCEVIVEVMILLIGQFYCNNNVVILIYGCGLINCLVIVIMKVYCFVCYCMVDDVELLVYEMFLIFKVMSEFKLGVVFVDLGKMVVKFKVEGNGCSIEDFVKVELVEVVGKQNGDVCEGIDVVFYGFGCIGCLLVCILIEKIGGGDGLCLCVIVVCKGVENDLVKWVSLLCWDLVYGLFDGIIIIDEENNMLIVNGNLIQVIYFNDLVLIDYIQYGIKNVLLVDNIGKWCDVEGFGQYLKCLGIDCVVFIVLGKGVLKNIVYGINYIDIGVDDKIILVVFCIINVIVLVLKVVNDQYGIVNGYVEIVYLYINDQNLIDNFYKGSCCGCSVLLNMVIIEIGVVIVVVKVLLVLKGKLIGNVICVLMLNVFMVIFNLNLEKVIICEEINEYLCQMVMYLDLQKQIDFVSFQEVVFIDFVGLCYVGVVDVEVIICNDNCVVLYVWYDNEFGYSCQVVCVMEDMVGVNLLVFLC